MKLRLTLADTSLVSSLLQYSSSTSSSTQVVSTSSLQAYYKLDGNSSDTAGTSTGSDVSITYATTSGKINTGASFTTSGSSYISLGTQPALACPSFCSISA